MVQILELYAGKFVWKLYAGKFFGSHMLKNSGGCRWLFEGGNYGTMLWYNTTVKTMVPGAQLSIPAAETFLE